MNILVGTAGFSYKDWVGTVYPADLKARKVPPLQYLARFYDLVEINTSFYGPLRPATAKQYPLAIEIRHSSWNEPAVLREFSSLGVGFVNIDQPLLGKALRGTRHVTGPLGYVRLHGRNYQQWFASSKVEDRYNFLYTPEQLEHWKERIEDISEQAERTFVVTNNHYLGKAAANATELKSMLTGKKVKAPGELVTTYPDLAAFAVA